MTAASRARIGKTYFVKHTYISSKCLLHVYNCMSKECHLGLNDMPQSDNTSAWKYRFQTKYKLNSLNTNVFSKFNFEKYVVCFLPSPKCWAEV